MKRLPEYPEQTADEIYDEIQQFKNTFYRQINKIDIYDDFTSTEMRLKNYVKDGKLNDIELLKDVQRILAYIDISPPKYMIKEPDSNVKYNCIVEISQSDCQKKFSTIKFNSTDKKRKIEYKNVWNFIQDNLKYITYKQFQFYTTNPQIFSIFRGFPYKHLSKFDFNIIKNFLWHTKFIICNGDNECYDYVVKWLAFIFRYPGKKTQTAILLTGTQGAGKTAWTNAICNLLGCYANPNARLSNIFGSFNLGIVNKMLIIINEVGTHTELTNDQNNKIKTEITEGETDINPKHQNSYSSKNIANFIFVSNESEPLKIEIDDRRFLVLEVNGEKKDNIEYFKALYGSYAAKGFYENLLTFFLQIKVDTMLDIKIPHTEAKEEIQLECSGYFSEFIETQKVNFIQGISVNDAQQLYNQWTTKNHVRPLTPNEYNRNMNRFCNKKRIGTGANRVYIWFLKNTNKPKITEEVHDEAPPKEVPEVHEEEEEEKEEVQKEEVPEAPEEEEEEEEKGFFEQFPLKSFDDNDDDDILSFF